MFRAPSNRERQSTSLNILSSTASCVNTRLRHVVVCDSTIRRFGRVRRTLSNMALTFNLPPTIHELMDDPIFAKMMRTRPRIPENLIHSTLSPAWNLWLLTTDDKWKRGRYANYEDAYRKMRELITDRHTADISIVSVRFMMAPPRGFVWRPRRNPWCARCRRPSLFLEDYNPRSLRDSDITFDESIRCFYCGIRSVALPKYSPS